VEKKYINIPIQNDQERQRVHFKVDGEVYTFNDIQVANGRIDYWTFVDVSKHRGKMFSFEFSDYVPGIEEIYQSDKFVSEDSLYKERLRLQVHPVFVIGTP
jgi:hypothetical protein